MIFSFEIEMQEEAPQTLHRVCRDLTTPSSSTTNTSTAAMVTAAINSILSSTSLTFLHHFLIPSLLLPPPTGFLIADDPQHGGSELALFKRRQLYVPMLAAFQQRYHGFGASLLVKIVEDYLLPLLSPSIQQPFIWLWFTYLLSRDFHSHDPANAHLASFSLRVSLKLTVNLRNKSPDRWTAAEAANMSQPAPREVLHQAAVPVVALANRLAKALESAEDSTSSNPLRQRAHELLDKILSSASTDEPKSPNSKPSVHEGSGGWEEVPEEEWVVCPIGLLPGYSRPSLGTLIAETDQV